MSQRPLPEVGDPEFEPFWSGAAVGELRVPRCRSCGRFRWPPRPVCPDCHGFDFGWESLPPQGRLYSWTVVEHQTVQGMQPPYVVGLVELDQGVRLLGNVVNPDGTVDRGALRVGLPVAAVFERVSDEVTLVNWTVIVSA